MGVFKAYLKICKSKASVVLIYVLIFAGVLYVFSQGGTNESKTFSDTKIRTAFISNDAGSELSKGLYKYLSQYCEFVDVPEEQIDDALFIREAEYVIEIPKEFEETFMDGGQPFVKRQSIPDSYTAIAVNSAINNYLNTAAVLLTYMDFGSTEELVNTVANCISVEADVSLFGSSLAEADSNAYYENYFNYLSYVMIACSILIIGTIMSTFQKLPIKRRNLVAPISIRKLNLKLLLCNAIFTTTFLVVFLVFGIATSKTHTVNEYYIFYVANAFSFSLVALALGYLFGLTIKNTNVLTLVSTVTSLAFAFLGGVFVPQDMLSNSALMVARFIPSYWYVSANSTIAKLTTFNWQNISGVLGNIGLQVAVALVLFAAALVYSKVKSKQEE